MMEKRATFPTGRARVWLPYSKLLVDARLRLFCFHHVGGSAGEFRLWTDAFGPAVDVLGVQMPGRENRMGEPPLKRMEALVDAVVTDLKCLMDRPVAFFGHSLGAHVAIEVAHRCLQEGVDLVHFFASGTRGPGCPQREDDFDMYDLPEDRFIEELGQFGGTPPEILENRELMALLVPVLRADFELAETFTHPPSPKLPCPLTAIGGIEDKDVSSEELETWSSQAGADFQRFLLPGDHFFLRTARARVLDIVGKRLLASMRASAKRA